MADLKDTLLRHLRAAREGLLWKCEGLSERDLRLPRTPTGTNLLGLVKHCAYIEHGYFVTCFSQPSPIVIPDLDYEADPIADLYATEDESAAEILALYPRVASVVDGVIEALPLEAPGHVEWWGERGDTTLGEVLVHVLGDVTRHAGQADILREGIDGQVGLRPSTSNVWEPREGWTEAVARLTRIAEMASEPHSR